MSDQCYWFANFLQKKCFCRVIRLILASFAKNILATFVSHCALVRQIFLEKCLINAFDLLIFYKKKILSCHSIDSGKFCKKNISNICVTLCKSAANFPIKMSDQCFWFANFLQKEILLCHSIDSVKFCKKKILATFVSHCAHVRRIFLEKLCVTIMCRNDEFSSTMSWVGCLLTDPRLADTLDLRELE